MLTPNNDDQHVCPSYRAPRQAEVLNQVINELLDDHPVSDVKLKEVLGHTPRQVSASVPALLRFWLTLPVCVR